MIVRIRPTGWLARLFVWLGLGPKGWEWDGARADWWPDDYRPHEPRTR
jgi:hypothetical protein